MDGKKLGCIFSYCVQNQKALAELFMKRERFAELDSYLNLEMQRTWRKQKKKEEKKSKEQKHNHHHQQHQQQFKKKKKKLFGICLLIVLLWKSLPVEDKFFNGLAKVVVMGDKYYLSPVDRWQIVRQHLKVSERVLMTQWPNVLQRNNLKNCSLLLLLLNLGHHKHVFLEERLKQRKKTGS